MSQPLPLLGRAALVIVIMSTTAWAQQTPPPSAPGQPPAQQVRPPPDPRIAGPMIEALRAGAEALRAEVTLRDAALRAMAEDAAKREAEWTEYVRPLLAAPAPTAESPK